MAAAPTRLPLWCTFCVLAFFLAHVATSSAQGLNYSQCVDGTYGHGGRICCRCGAGQYLKEHCTTSQQRGKCESCPLNTYRSLPNSLDSCEPCTSCSQPNANLEVKQSCTSANDTKCRCKKDHYCSGGTEPCRICHPCKECPEGIKVACTTNYNTVCDEKNEGVHHIGVIMGIVAIIIIIIIILLVLAIYFIRKRHRGEHQISAQPNDADVELPPLLAPAPVVDLQPHLSDIAEIIGWRDMQDIAMRSSISDTIIESCKLDYPNYSQDQTVQLLKIWVEKQGNEASRNLIEILQSTGKRNKAEKVMGILSPP